MQDEGKRVNEKKDGHHQGAPGNWTGEWLTRQEVQEQSP
jgi:hypothetical protein